MLGEYVARLALSRSVSLIRVFPHLAALLLTSKLADHSLAPTDATDAASTSLYDPNASTSSASSSSDLKIAPIQGDWDEELLGIVMGDHELTREFYPGDQLGAERLRGMLGEVVRDGGKAVS